MLQVVRLRFGETGVSAFREAVERVADMDRQEALLASAIQSRRVSQFRKTLGGA